MTAPTARRNTMILTHKKAKSLRDEFSNDPLELIREVEAAVIRKLAAGVSVEPAYKAKPYGSLPTVVVSAQVDYYLLSQLNTAIAAARVQAIEECANDVESLIKLLGE